MFSASVHFRDCENQCREACDINHQHKDFTIYQNTSAESPTPKSIRSEFGTIEIHPFNPEIDDFITFWRSLVMQKKR